MMARILLVDDDPDQLEIRSLILAKAGHQARGAANAETAVRLLDEWPADVVVMDLRLPTSDDGAMLIREIRSRCPGAKIILLSGSPEELERFPEQSMVDQSLRKPVRSAHLLSLISRAG